MSRKIRLSEEDLERLASEFKNSLKAEKCPLDKMNYSINLNLDSATQNKIKVVFSECAYVKMKLLVHDFDTEVQWQGIVTRENEDTFKVNDIFVPPHTVTGATVTSDPEKYQAWIEEMEQLGHKDNLRFHGHSHVNMAVSPSYVDMNYRKDVIRNFSPLFENNFYIFMIINKKGDISGQVYDMGNNILYETDDIEFLYETQYDIDEFLKEAHQQATAAITSNFYQNNKNTKENKTKSKSSGYHIDGYDDYDGGYYSFMEDRDRLY